MAGWLLLALLWLIALIHARTANTPIVDEWVHAAQIFTFLHGHLHDVNSGLTNIPGYHLLVAGIMKLFGSQSLAGARTVSMCFGLLGGVFFYLVRRELVQEHVSRTVVQFLFFPLLYPYCFLAYTDVLSVALVLAAFWATLRDRHLWAALVLVAAMAVRQNDVLWAGFLAMYALWPILRATRWQPWLAASEVFCIAWPYCVAVLLFLAYWAWNGSIVFANALANIHPDASLDWGNPFFFLFVAGIFLPLQLWGGLQRFVLAARTNSWWLLFPLGIFAIYAAGFAVTCLGNLMGADHFLHNAVLVAVTRNHWAWWGFGLIATVAACGLAHTQFGAPQGWLLFPFAAFYLAASWLIEGRYTLIPFALWLALRRQGNDTAERITLGIWVVLAQFFALSILASRFML
jgi:alpha-1,2-glucosyltransferase